MEGCHWGSFWRGYERSAKLPISPLVGEMPGRAEGGAKDRGLPGLLRVRSAERWREEAIAVN
ncbi:MAG: hypothetical protein EOS56_18725 [Mesorhizobium sp.]|nr:MAG: hypothetical protein EOS27_28525 [Mesorhizobium sp.]RWC58943.1 MAG: hypothetical protein EOS56_18725 [Mesorhizobium sp.]RWC66555.1 MAG: hypothetical protein EOS29_04080 [Mesorhizobium sp.]